MDSAIVRSKVAARLAVKGSPCTATITSGSAYDIETAKMVLTTSTVSGHAVEESRGYSSDPTTGRTVERRTVWVVCEALILPGHSFEWDGLTFTVAEADPISPDGAGVPIINKLVVTR